MILLAKVRISEQKAKRFLSFFERKCFLAKRKGSANRTKNQIYLSFSEMQPTFSQSEKVVQIERKTKCFLCDTNEDMGLRKEKKKKFGKMK